jgi:predicted HTH domain antitoxin
MAVITKEFKAAVSQSDLEVRIDMENEKWWFYVLQIALSELGVQSLGKTAEVSRLSIEEVLELRGKIYRQFEIFEEDLK